MLTTSAQPTKTQKPLTQTVLPSRPASNRPQPSFLALLLRTLSAFAV